MHLVSKAGGERLPMCRRTNSNESALASVCLNLGETKLTPLGKSGASFRATDPLHPGARAEIERRASLPIE